MIYGAIIPAYNAGKRIIPVIEGVRKYLGQNIIVVNDGSTDDTSQIAENKNTIVLSHNQNTGKGGALKTGFRKALSLNWSAIITLDADGQHDPKFIPDFIHTFENANFDIIIGSRMWNTGSMPFHRIFSNKTTSLLISRRIGQPITDSQSGYRLIRAGLLNEIRLNTSHYDTETEILLKSGLKNFKIGYINIDTVYDGEPSSMNLVVDTLRFIRLYLASLFW